MLNTKKLLTVLITLLAIVFEIVSLPIAFLGSLIFYKKLRNLSPQNKQVFILSLSTYLLYFLITMILGSLLYNINQSLAIKEIFDRSFIYFLLIYALMFKLIYWNDLKVNIRSKDCLLNYSKIIILFFLATTIAMTATGFISENLWDRFFVPSKILTLLFIIPIYGFIKNQNINLKWKFYKIFVCVYLSFILTNFSLLFSKLLR